MIWRELPSKSAAANYCIGFRSLALSPDGFSVAVPVGSKLRGVDRKGRRVKWTAQGHNDFVMVVAYSPRWPDACLRWTRQRGQIMGLRQRKADRHAGQHVSGGGDRDETAGAWLWQTKRET